MIFRRLLRRGDSLDVEYGWSWWSWTLGWEIEWHPHEATLHIHLGPARVIVWWWRR